MEDWPRVAGAYNSANPLTTRSRAALNPHQSSLVGVNGQLPPTPVETSMLVALSLLWLLGLRYPLQMLPILLFEITWKFIWMIVVVIPLWTSGQLDPATLSVFYACLLVVIPLAVIPWRYVAAHYVRKPGDPWRPTAHS